MILKNVVDEDFCNYKLPSMFLIFPYCDFKCDRENGDQLCQNMPIIKEPNIDVNITELCERYINNPITKAVVCGGLEPMESWHDLELLVKILRWDFNCHDDIVIYTGFNKEEIEDKVNSLKRFDNIVIKFGRFRPNQESHYDEVLGVSLASDNQYAEVIS